MACFFQFTVYLSESAIAFIAFAPSELIGRNGRRQGPQSMPIKVSIAFSQGITPYFTSSAIMAFASFWIL